MIAFLGLETNTRERTKPTNIRMTSTLSNILSLQYKTRHLIGFIYLFFMWFCSFTVYSQFPGLSASIFIREAVCACSSVLPELICMNVQFWSADIFKVKAFNYKRNSHDALLISSWYSTLFLFYRCLCEPWGGFKAWWAGSW